MQNNKLSLSIVFLMMTTAVLITVVYVIFGVKDKVRSHNRKYLKDSKVTVSGDYFTAFASSYALCIGYVLVPFVYIQTSTEYTVSKLIREYYIQSVVVLTIFIIISFFILSILVEYIERFFARKRVKSIIFEKFIFLK